MNGNGIAAARARIEAAFRTLHNDCRDRSQVQADRVLREALKPEDLAESNIQVQAAAATFHSKAKTLVEAAALRLPPTRRSSLRHRAFWVGDINRQPSYEATVEAALRSLQKKESK